MSSFIIMLLSIPIVAFGFPSQRPQGLVMLAAALCGSAVALLLSVRSMGWKNSGLFFVVAVGAALLAEYVGVNRLMVVTHLLHPQLARIPIAILLGWYIALVVAYALTAALWEDAGMGFTAIGTGLVATIYDFAMDPFGLALGWWVWHQPGDFARSVGGANGVPGIPWGNFLGWFLLASGVTLLLEWLIRKERFYAVRFELKWAGLFYFALCLPGLVWALRTQHFSVFIAPALPLGVLGLMTLWKLMTGQRRISPGD